MRALTSTPASTGSEESPRSAARSASTRLPPNECASRTDYPNRRHTRLTCPQVAKNFLLLSFRDPQVTSYLGSQLVAGLQGAGCKLGRSLPQIGTMSTRCRPPYGARHVGS